jgi:hypothetical protein
MTEKIHQNRIVVVGRSPKDAYTYANGPRFRDSLDSPVLINAAAHALAILGGFPSHDGSVYVTPTAPEGANYDAVEAAIERARERNPNLQVVEEPREVVHA